MSSPLTLRVARPTAHQAKMATMYSHGLRLSVLARFEDHDGFDGVILGDPGQHYHLEFTTRRGESVVDTPSPDSVLVFYVPDRVEWDAACARMIAAGFRRVRSYNPYWDIAGQTFEDDDHYRVVLQNAEWRVDAG